MTQVKRQPQNSSASHLLTNEENATLVRILGPRCPSLATAVVQIYMSDSSSGKQVDTLSMFYEQRLSTTIFKPIEYFENICNATG